MNSTNLSLPQHYPPEDNCDLIETSVHSTIAGLAIFCPPLGVLSPLASLAFKSRANKLSSFWNNCVKDLDSKYSDLNARICNLEETQQNYIFTNIENILVKVALEPNSEKIKYFENAVKNILYDLPLAESECIENNDFIETLNVLKLADLRILAYLYPRFDELQEMDSSHLPWWNNFGKLLNENMDEKISRQSSLRLEQRGLADIDHLPRSGAVTLHLRLNLHGRNFAEFCLPTNDISQKKITYPLWKYNLVINNDLDYEYYSFHKFDNEEQLYNYVQTTNDPQLLNITIQTIEVRDLRKMSCSLNKGYFYNGGISAKQENGCYQHNIPPHEAILKSLIQVVND